MSPSSATGDIVSEPGGATPGGEQLRRSSQSEPYLRKEIAASLEASQGVSPLPSSEAEHEWDVASVTSSELIKMQEITPAAGSPVSTAPAAGAMDSGVDTDKQLEDDYPVLTVEVPPVDGEGKSLVNIVVIPSDSDYAEEAPSEDERVLVIPQQQLDAPKLNGAVNDVHPTTEDQWPSERVDQLANLPESVLEDYTAIDSFLCYPPSQASVSFSMPVLTKETAEPLNVKVAAAGPPTAVLVQDEQNVDDSLHLELSENSSDGINLSQGETPRDIRDFLDNV